MRKRFNTAGRCRPTMHYMVNLDNRLKEIKKLVDQGEYFVINRGRQYGKTTTLFALAEYLKKDYVVAHLDFQQMTSDYFSNGHIFATAFVRFFSRVLVENCGAKYLDENNFKALSSDAPALDMAVLFERLRDLCKTAQKPIVLIIDEVDQASNNQVFLDFLMQLRFYYFTDDRQATFQSVILAGVYDIKNLRAKYTHDGGHKLNSPWNIAAKFKVDMDFSSDDIESMLNEYEADAHTGMDIPKIAQLIYSYTSGYPVLVSSICKELDEEITGTKAFPTPSSAWTEAGVMEAVRVIVKDQASPAMIFQSLTKYVDEFPNLKNMLKKVFFNGEATDYIDSNATISLGTMFGFIKENGGKIQVANRMFEMKLYNKLLADESEENPFSQFGSDNRPLFVKDGKLNMELVLEKFVEYFKFTENDAVNKDGFLENQGRRMFLLYLRPIINGVGNYYVEPESRNKRKADVVVDYHGQQYIIEMKIWRGPVYLDEGEKQLTDYLVQYNLDTGYMLTFSFLKDKVVGIKKTTVNGKTIVEATV